MFNNFGYGKRVGPLHSITNFDVNVIMNETNIFGEKLIDSFESIGLWDSVSIQCFRRIKKIHDSYERIVPLIQHYQPEKVKSSITQTKENTSKLNPEMDSSKPKINVILFCIDAVSRLNFLRQMPETKKFFDSHSFYPFYGYHKVAYNSFPNMFGVYSGKLNPTGNDLLLDDYHKIPFLWKLFQKKGYLTTFIDDMPAYSFFSYLSGPLLTKPVNYFLRPTSVMMDPQLYDDDDFDACYQEGLEKVYLWKYFMDQLKAFELRNQSHFSIVHTSRVTHNYLNYAGYLDIPLKRFMVELFDRNFHQNSIIVVLADHSLNFGPILSTESGKFEKRFPLFYLYIPDSLKLDGHNADELRKIIQNNQHLMTSHFDLHATLLHFLGFSNTTSNDTWGSSLLKPIDPYRTCELTKIPSEYCSCKPYRKIEINDNVTYYSWVAIDHINGILEREGKKRCVPLQLDNILSAFEKTKYKLSSVSGERMLLIDISTKPKMATFQVTIKLYRQHFGLNNVHSVIAHRIVNVHRTNQYGNDSHCVENVPMLRPLCLCWDRLP
ncbi:hypothetical protein RDWZM_006513 [Blomia tropicalis]|uniref:Uncharacterized protein n=1 Tax=Blomia tropicalis TaxID=40697 RepID=A0A9Q0RNH0_BLOTA|nr:hypothetical protein RDWZM_006513 [Blomia tropicalis]